MMIIPMPYRSRPYVAPRCPHCNKSLSGWEPPADHWYDSWFGIIAIVLAAVVLVVVGMNTVLEWFVSSKTLTQVIAEEWHWFAALMHRIY